jgi:hypothetical protein
MRSLRRLPDGSYTIDPAKELDRDNLCNFCGFDDCSIRAIHDRLRENKFGAKLRIITCKTFIPVLEFRQPLGLQGSFNTFRLGGGWAKRLVPEQVVSLSGPSLVASARVREVHLGTFNEMNARFGPQNHMMIHATKEKLDWSLDKIMLSNYGPRVFNPEGPVSVIALERVL